MPHLKHVAFTSPVIIHSLRSYIFRKLLSIVDLPFFHKSSVIGLVHPAVKMQWVTGEESSGIRTVPLTQPLYRVFLLWGKAWVPAQFVPTITWPLLFARRPSLWTRMWKFRVSEDPAVVSESHWMFLQSQVYLYFQVFFFFKNSKDVLMCYLTYLLLLSLRRERGWYAHVNNANNVLSQLKNSSFPFHILSLSKSSGKITFAKGGH